MKYSKIKLTSTLCAGSTDFIGCGNKKWINQFGKLDIVVIASTSLEQSELQ